MKFFQEITVWDDNTPNHVYLLNDSKNRMAGYVPDQTEKLIMLSTPIQFNTRYRKFRAVPDQWTNNASEIH